MTRRELDATGDRDTLLLVGGGAALAALLVGGVWFGEHAAAWLSGRPAPAGDPVHLVLEVATGRLPWPTTATVLLGVLLALIAAGVVGLALLWPRRLRPDRAASRMGRGRDVDHLTTAGATRKATRLGVHDAGPGLPIGRTVAGGRRLFSTWEDMAILIAGPRTQKTTAFAVPAILAAPGACLATSNKRDILDVTARARADVGRVWTFDPQHVANAERSWWWNPCAYVGLGDDASETRAERLAAQLVTSSRPAGARTDAYFDGEAQNLLGLLLLAAACGSRPVTDVYRWLTRPTSDEPADILAEHHFELQHDAVYALSHLPDKQREGVYGTARSLVGWLRNRDVQTWITQPEQGREFHPVDFAHSRDTLYALSKDGDASAGPLVAALTLAVLEALEEAAADSPGGRLAVPFVGVLDEAANIVRLRNLDSYYSHYGSRGIVLLTILQSWHQGAEVWGDHGIEKLWSAANIRIFGGAVDDDRFLRRLSELIGPYERIMRSATWQRGRRNLTRSTQEKVILTPAELRELPPGRAVVFASGTPAVLVEPVPWFRDKRAVAKCGESA